MSSIDEIDRDLLDAHEIIGDRTFAPRVDHSELLDSILTGSCSRWQIIEIGINDGSRGTNRITWWLQGNPPIVQAEWGDAYSFVGSFSPCKRGSCWRQGWRRGAEEVRLHGASFLSLCGDPTMCPIINSRDSCNLSWTTFSGRCLSQNQRVRPSWEPWSKVQLTVTIYGIKWKCGFRPGPLWNYGNLRGPKVKFTLVLF